MGRNHVRTAGSGCPDDLGIHRTDGNQQLLGAALCGIKAG